MTMNYARALCEDFIHINIPEDKNGVCSIQFIGPREINSAWCSAAMIDRELAIALKTLISGKENKDE